ncbi:MAG: hypothetical protein HYS26_00910 [Candidatus Kaiserbacteria bacterium]|nr:MAG: hypothetical protein HYS26_00910 [Candidatus Kaiserbacteria bacterium]
MQKSSRGVTTLIVVAFMGIFLIVMGTITSYVFEQAKYGRALHAREQAIAIAESGLEYYKWFLAHNPAILVSGSGLISPYTHSVSDPEGGAVGSAEITATSALQCNRVQWIDLESKGTAAIDTRFPRTILARYMRPSVAEYAFLLNSNVWFTSSNLSNGPYFSNGGIRQDGLNNSTVSSAVSTWNCTTSYNCNPAQPSAPGVVGSGPGFALWQYPVASIDFAGVASNFGTLQTLANTSGIYLSGTATYVAGAQQGSSYSSVAASDQRGYHLVFNSNGTVTIYRVTATNGSTQGYRTETGQWHLEYDVITGETLLGTFTPPSGCSVIYVNAKAWIEGTVSGKVTVVAADTGNYAPDVLPVNNIGYTTTDGSTGLTVIAEHSIRFPINVPNTMTLRGIFVAQSGYYGRDYYYAGYTGGYDSYILRSSLTVAGSIASNVRAGTVWFDSYGNVTNGFQTRTNTYDQILAFSPPPFTPSTSVDYGLVLWREQ